MPDAYVYCCVCGKPSLDGVIPDTDIVLSTCDLVICEHHSAEDLAEALKRLGLDVTKTEEDQPRDK